jgi:hypothetical protein
MPSIFNDYPDGSAYFPCVFFNKIYSQDTVSLIEEKSMLTINRHEPLPKSFYYLGAAIVVVSIIILAIRIHPTLDFGLFKPGSQSQSSSDNPGSTSKNSTNSSDSSARQPGSKSGVNASSAGSQTGGSSNGSGTSSPRQQAGAVSPGTSRSAPASSGSVSSGPIVGNGGSGGSAPPTHGEPDGDELPTLTLPPINIAPSVQVPKLLF